MSNLQDTLTKLCCCFDIEYGGFIVGVTRIVLHLARIMIAIILLMGGIVEGIETTTIASGGAGNSNAEATTAAAFSRELTKDDMKVMGDCKKFLTV